MDNVSKVIFTCLAIGYTFLIYQNNELKGDVEKLKGYAQIDTDKVWKRMDSMAIDIDYNTNINDGLFRGLELQTAWNKNMDNVVDDILDDVDDNESEIQAIAESIAEIERSIRRLPKSKPTQQIKNIISSCKTNTVGWDTHDHKLKC